jgi:hypothetical protein
MGFWSSTARLIPGSGDYRVDWATIGVGLVRKQRPCNQWLSNRNIITLFVGALIRPWMSPEARYLKWRRQQPAIGCVFARLIASNPKRYEQQVDRINGQDPMRVARRIESIVGPAVASANVSSVVLIFPDLVKLEAVASAMLALNGVPGWKVTWTKLKPPPAMVCVALNIVREIRFGSGTCPSEALVLGPFRSFPPTRRAPVTALEIFVGEPRPMGPLDDTPTQKANLAHIELNLATHAIFMKMWKKSHDARTKSLGDRADNRAKAKVSLVVPTLMARRLGCCP